jgi:hypothetical protein
MFMAVWLLKSSVAPDLSCRLYLDIYWHEGKFLRTFWAFALMHVDNFVWRFKLRALIQDMFTSVTNNTLRQHGPLLTGKKQAGHIYQLLLF